MSCRDFMWLVHVNGREVRQGSGAGGGSGFVDLKYEQVFAEAAVPGGEDAGGMLSDVERAIVVGDGWGGWSRPFNLESF